MIVEVAIADGIHHIRATISPTGMVVVMVIIVTEDKARVGRAQRSCLVKPLSL